MTLAKITELLGSEWPSAIAEAFDKMEIAERVIRAKLRTAKHRERVWNAFGACRSPLLDRKTGKLFEAHCREIVDRAENGASMEAPTKAEICAGFAGASFKAPLRREATALYQEYFVEIMGKGYDAQLGKPLEVDDEWAKPEMLRFIHQKMRNEQRQEEYKAQRDNPLPEWLVGELAGKRTA